jgi:hypothetical protein
MSSLHPVFLNVSASQEKQKARGCRKRDSPFSFFLQLFPYAFSSNLTPNGIPLSRINCGKSS